MSTWETPESIIDQRRVCVLANICIHKNPMRVECRSVAHSNQIVLEVLGVWLTTGKHIRSWFPEQVLHSLSEEKGKGKREGEAHPSSIRFPEFPSPYQGFGCIRADSRSWDKQKADYEDYPSWDNQRQDD